IIARLLSSKLDWSEVKDGRVAAEAELNQRAEAEKRTADAVLIREQPQQRELAREEEKYNEARHEAVTRHELLFARFTSRARRNLMASLVLGSIGVVTAASTLGPALTTYPLERA